MDFRSSQDENDMFRWLLERFEQGVEGRCGQHVHFVDDVYFVLCRNRCCVYFFAQVTDFIDTAVAGSIYLNNIDMIVLMVIWQPVHFVCQNTGNRGFAGATWTGK